MDRLVGNGSSVALRAQQTTEESKFNNKSAAVNLNLLGDLGVNYSQANVAINKEEEIVQNVTIGELDNIKLKGDGNNLNICNKVNGATAETRNGIKKEKVDNNNFSVGATFNLLTSTLTGVNVGAGSQKGEKLDTKSVEAIGADKKNVETYNNIIGASASIRFNSNNPFESLKDLFNSINNIKVSKGEYGLELDLAAYKELSKAIEENIALRDEFIKSLDEGFLNNINNSIKKDILNDILTEELTEEQLLEEKYNTREDKVRYFINLWKILKLLTKKQLKI